MDVGKEPGAPGAPVAGAAVSTGHLRLYMDEIMTFEALYGPDYDIWGPMWRRL